MNLEQIQQEFEEAKANYEAGELNAAEYEATCSILQLSCELLEDVSDLESQAQLQKAINAAMQIISKIS